MLPAATGGCPSRCAKGVVPPTRGGARGLGAATPGAEVLADQGARPADASAAEEFYVRTWAEPSLDVHGIEGGSPQLQKTVIPVVAEANLSIRLAAGPEAGGDRAEVERLLREAAPDGRRARDRALVGSTGRASSPPDAAAIRLGQDAFERALGARPLLLRAGGSLPIVAGARPSEASRRSSPASTLPEGNLHSPNERLLVEHFPLGVAAARELFIALAELR